jgi:hypothetical protein
MVVGDYYFRHAHCRKFYRTKRYVPLSGAHPQKRSSSTSSRQEACLRPAERLYGTLSGGLPSGSWSRERSLMPHRSLPQVISATIGGVPCARSSARVWPLGDNPSRASPNLGRAAVQLSRAPSERVNLLYSHIAEDYRRFGRIESEVNAGEKTGLPDAVEAHHYFHPLIAHAHSHHRRVLAMPDEVHVLHIARPTLDARAR